MKCCCCCCRNSSRVFAALVLTVSTLAASKCPKDLFASIGECTTKATPFNPSDGHVEKLKATCWDGTLHHVIDCIQQLIDRCPGNGENEKQLRRNFDVNSMRKSINYLCQNLDGFEKHFECFKRSHNEIGNCSMSENSLFIKSSSKKASQVDMKSNCLSYLRVYRCVDTKLKRICGEETASFLYNTLVGFKSKVCERFVSGGRNTGSSWKLTLLAPLAVLVVRSVS